MTGLPRLPACRQCYQRKVKCDSRRPKCETCAKHHSECVFADPATGEIVSRQELAELERNVRQLSGSTKDENQEAQNEQDGSPEHEDEAGSRVAQGSGLGFMSPLFNDQEWRQSNAFVLRSLANASATAELTIESNELPSAEEAKVLFDSYLRSVHIQNPILLRQDVLALYGRIFQCQTSDVPPRKHDLFRTFMVLALGSIHPYRKGQHQWNPFGYYLSAMRHFDRFLIRDGLSPIQDLLLLTRFGIYHHIGTSIWSLTRLCVRMSVEQGLHKRQESFLGDDLLQEQMRRRVFWICYMMDRYSSITLNRPFAISDSDIEIGMVADADDQYFETSHLTVPRFDDLISPSTPMPPTELSAFISCVRLRQISSRIHRYFADTLNSQICSRAEHNEIFLATGHIHAAVQKFLAELESWRAFAPVYEAPQCTFERAEWYDLQQAREAFNLLRRALDVAPKRNGAPSRGLLEQCQASAIRVIQLYSDMFSRSLATFTRSYFQMMFTAGLSLLYCSSVLVRVEPSLIGECSRALEQCRITLTDMTVNLPDARHYVGVFDALFRHILKNLNQFFERAGSTQQDDTSITILPTNSNESTNISYAEPGRSANELEIQNVGYQFQNAEHHYLRDGEGGSGLDPMYAMSIPQVLGDAQNYLTAEGLSVIDSDLWNWDLLNDEALWNVGHFVLGDPSADLGLYDPN